mmetsp:Transcript_36169/g.46639  ORF Transcript_36169/g.46639 Transcript_36169/m.46639 type:complete len:102 (-) Transcript_36169:551-856(-)
MHINQLSIKWLFLKKGRLFVHPSWTQYPTKSSNKVPFLFFFFFFSFIFFWRQDYYYFFVDDFGRFFWRFDFGDDGDELKAEELEERDEVEPAVEVAGQTST